MERECSEMRAGEGSRILKREVLAARRMGSNARRGVGATLRKFATFQKKKKKRNLQRKFDFEL